MSSIEISNITYKVNNKILLDNVSITAKSKKITTILGPSGSGKSTLLKIIAGLINPNSGTIKIEKKDISNLDSFDRNIGYVSQNPSLLPYLNIRNNISMAIRDKSLKSDEAYIERLLKIISMGNYINSFPHELSIGQQQKISILRALASSPNILLFDEPYANLDIINKDILMKESIEITNNSSAAKILVTHNPYEAMILSDYIYVINGGKIIQEGSISDLYTKPANNFIANLFGITNIIRDNNKEIIIRAEDIKLATKKLGHNDKDALIESKKFFYGKFLYNLNYSGNLIRAISADEFSIGQKVYFSF